MFGGRTLRRFSYLVDAYGRLRWDKKKLQKYQIKQLRKVVKNAYDNVFFYREQFKAIGVSPFDIKTLDDLNKLPIVTKSEMKKRSKSELVSRIFGSETLEGLKTGGSTGEPFSIYVSKKENDWRLSSALKGNISCGQRARDRWVALIDAESSGTPHPIRSWSGIFARSTVPVTWSRIKQLKTVEEANPDVLDGFSGSIWLLAREKELRNVRSIHPRIIFGTAEFISRTSRKFVEETLGAPYLDQFGCAEIGRSAWQCPERLGYHMDVDSVITQFVDKNGEEVEPGETGRIVYTSLFSYSMPFIRYCINDVGKPVDDDCPCGRTLPLMKVVEGRSNEFLVFPDGNMVTPMSFIETLGAFRFVREIDQYRVVQRRTDLIEIYVKKAYENVNEEWLENNLLNNIVEGLPKIERVDVSRVRFRVCFVDDLPLIGRGKLNVISSQVSIP